MRSEKVDMSTVKDMIDESIVGKLKEGKENIAQASEDIKNLERVKQEKIII